MKVGIHFQDPALTLKLHPKCLSCLTLCLSLVGCMEQISLRKKVVNACSPHLGGVGWGGPGEMQIEWNFTKVRTGLWEFSNHLGL